MIKSTAKALGLLLAVLYLTACTQVRETAAPPELKLPAEAPPSPKFHYLESRVHFQKNRFAESAAALEKAIQADPDSSFLKRELIRLTIKQGNKETALDLAESLVSRHPGDVENLLLLVRLKKENGRENGMAGLLKQILDLDTQNKETYLRLGKIHMENQQFSQALELFTRMVENLPDYYVAHFYLGEAHLLSKDYEQARLAFLKTIELEPNLVEPRFRLIEIHRQQKSGKTGIKDILGFYEKILEIEPGNDRALLEMALLHHRAGNRKKSAALFQEQGRDAQAVSRRIMAAVDTFLSEKRFDDAIVVFSQMLKADPDNENLHFFLGMAYESKKELAKAIDHYLKVTPAHPQYKKTILTIGFLYRDMGQGKLAVRFLEQHHEKLPKDIDLISYLSSFYEGENMLDKAMALLEKGLADAPENTGLLFRLGAVQDKAGRKDDCIQTMKKIIRIDPNDASALNYLGYTWAEMGVNLDQAEELISKALKIRPDDGYITDSMGWVYFQKQEYEKAVVYLEKAAEISKYETIIAGHLGDAYAKTGRFGDALAAYKKAVANAKETDAELVEILKAKIRALQEQLKNGKTQ